MTGSLINRCAWLCGVFSVVILVVACQETPNKGEVKSTPLKVSASGFSGQTVAFLPQTNYVAMPLPFAPFGELYRELSNQVPEKLISRGEAHITVLTPPEFEQLKTQMSIDEINAIAIALDIQNVSVKPFCLGRGDAVIEGRHEQTYFVVVEAAGLRKIRQAIAQEFAKRGGAAGAFDAEHFYPHVTVGFTKRDLFEQDGIVKDLKSCAFDLEFHQ